MATLFINGSPEKNGNTARLAKLLLADITYETINLIDYRINTYEQELPGDQFDEVVDKIKKADIVVVGSPLYWHNMSGAIRTVLDRFYGNVSENEFRGKKLFFIFQGAAPEKWMLEGGEYTMKRFAQLYGMTYMGKVSNKSEAISLSKVIKS